MAEDNDRSGVCFHWDMFVWSHLATCKVIRK